MGRENKIGKCWVDNKKLLDCEILFNMFLVSVIIWMKICDLKYILGIYVYKFLK